MGRGKSPHDIPEGDQGYGRYDDSAYHDAAGDTGYHDGTGYRGAPYGDDYDLSRHTGAALVPLGESDANLPAVANGNGTVVPVIIPGTGVSMGNPFIKRRERPLTMRIAVVTLMACIVVTGLFAVTPLTSNANGDDVSSFQALSGAVVWHKAPTFHWYTAQFGDTPEKIADMFNVQVGGIYEMNSLMAGQEITVGKAYKIPDDPNYGKDYRPASIATGGYGATTYGSSPWTSLAGTPPPEALCGPNGNGNPSGYHLVSPNPNSYWVRGFTWFHNGIDLSTVAGNPIHAAQDGEVIFAGWDVGGLGWSAKINHCNHVSTVYGHMEKLLVKVHDLVQAGNTIGLEGSTGWSTGPHLHFMVEWDNNPIDPMPYYNYNEYAITH
jgi:hypothetical protein